VVGRFEDEVALARSLLTPGRWRAAAFVGAGTDEVLAALPAASRDGLLGPAQWVPAAAPPDPADGPSADWFVAAYRRLAGADPPYPAAQAFAAGVLALRCRPHGGDDLAALNAAAALDTTTLLGRFRLDPATGLQVGHEVLTVQWQDGRRRVVWPVGVAEAGVVVGR
jgi:branched-chain amino acid transport system substrate-binding protein